MSALGDSAHQRSENVRLRALAAIQRLESDGQPISFAAVSREAGVSRTVLYSNPELRAAVERGRGEQPVTRARPETATVFSLRARVETLLIDNDRLRRENEALHRRLSELLIQARRSPGRATQ